MQEHLTKETLNVSRLFVKVSLKFLLQTAPWMKDVKQELLLPAAHIVPLPAITATVFREIHQNVMQESSTTDL
jgi:hypothetical protein